MTYFSEIRRNALKTWKTRSKRVFKVTDNFTKSIECKWQDWAYYNGYNHISVFCSLNSNEISELLDLIPSLEYIIKIILNGYSVLDILFKNDVSKIKFICEHFENK